MTPADARPVEIFFSYAHEDEFLRDELNKHLAGLKRQGVIKAWHDREIRAGEAWAGQIDEHLEKAQIILLLVSPDFMASDYCFDIEVKRALKRHESGEACVIPVILREVDWSGAPFSKLQALPKDALPVTSWPDRDRALADVARGIRKVVEMTARKEPPPTDEAVNTSKEETDGQSGASNGKLSPPSPQSSIAAHLSPLTTLKEAIRAVPAVKYALGVAGVGAAVAIIAGFKVNYKIAVLGVVIMFVLMFVLVIFSSFARSATKSLRPLALTLAWSFVILTITTAVFIFTGFFLSWPRPLEQTAESIAGSSSPTPIPTPATPMSTPSPTLAGPTRLLNYSISVCKAPDDPGCNKPFPLAGEINFENGYVIKVNISSPQTGQLYIINQGPLLNDNLPQYVLLFPNERLNDGSSGLDANQILTIPSDSWLRFDNEEGKEKLWLVWSEDSVGVLENAAREATLTRKRNSGAITKPALIIAVRDYLNKYLLPPPDVVRNEEINQTSVKIQGKVLVYAIKLEHH